MQEWARGCGREEVGGGGGGGGGVGLLDATITPVRGEPQGKTKVRWEGWRDMPKFEGSGHNGDDKPKIIRKTPYL